MDCSMPGLPVHHQLLEFTQTHVHWWKRRWHPTPVILAGKSHGQRSLVGCSPWGHEESDQLSDLTFTFHFHALEKEMATYSSVLAWRVPGMGQPGGLPSMGSHRVRHNWSSLAAVAAYLNGLVIFPTFFNFSLNLTIRSLWSKPQSASSLVFADCIELLHLWLQRI